MRDYLKDHPDAMTGEIAAALNKQGIEITPSHVATIKTKINKTGTAKKAAKKRRQSWQQPRQSSRSRQERRHDHAGAGQEGRLHDQDDRRLPACARSAGGHQGVGRREEVPGAGGSHDGPRDGRDPILSSPASVVRPTLMRGPPCSCLRGGLLCRPPQWVPTRAK